MLTYIVTRNIDSRTVYTHWLLTVELARFFFYLKKISVHGNSYERFCVTPKRRARFGGLGLGLSFVRSIQPACFAAPASASPDV